MRSFLLLFLSLITGCEAWAVYGCTEGWVEFTCEYPKGNKIYHSIEVETKKKPMQSTQKDKWENKHPFFLYHDTKNKNLRVIIKQLKKEDFGEYQCKFHPGHNYFHDTDTVYLKVIEEKNGCQTPFFQTAYRTAKTTISCDYPNKYNSRVKFFCKDNGSICEDILSTKSLKSNGTFTLTETNSGINMSISNVSSQHAGVYWCGVESRTGSNRGSLRKIQLEVKATYTNFTKSPTIGQNLTYWCAYRNKTLKSNKKFICKGEDPSICEPLVTTLQSNKSTGKFSMTEKKEGNITITVRNVMISDTGTYWCGVEITNKTHGNQFFHKLLMTVVPTPTLPVSSTMSTTVSAGVRGDPQVVITAIVCVLVLLLLLVLFSILIYKRHLKNRRNAEAAQHIKEDYTYEEIQERAQKPDSGCAINSVYVTANFTTNPSASLHYSTIGFQNRADEAVGEALITKPSSSACEYSTVKDSQSPTYSTVNQPSPEDPLYSTVNKHKNNDKKSQSDVY